MRSGMSSGGVNLANFYREGKQGLISPQPEKAIEVYRYGAEKGYPSYFFYYANELYDQGKKEDAFDLYRRAAELESPGPSSGRATPTSWRGGVQGLRPGRTILPAGTLGSHRGKSEPRQPAGDVLL